jgi:3'-5' exoribonuclease
MSNRQAKDKIARDKQELAEINSTLSPIWRDFNKKVIENKDFCSCPSSLTNHHTYIGGLLNHTLEVVKFAYFTWEMNPSINKDILITGAIWHDFGKIWDYEFECGTYKESSHKKKIYHICRSYHEFLKESEFKKIYNEYVEEIAHLILSHHNLPQYDSPRRPQTIEAWALHLADMNSAFCGGYRDSYVA